MRSRKTVLLVCLIALIVLTGCQSTVTVKHLHPAEVNLGNYRTLAIASTGVGTMGRAYGFSNVRFDDFGLWLSSGYQSGTASSAAQYASSMLTGALQASDFFTVYPPENTDNYLGLGMDGYKMLQNKGVTAVVTSSISYFDLDENTYTEDVTEYRTDKTTGKSVKYVTGKKYYLEQTVTLTLTYAVKDLQSGTILTSDSLTGKRSRDTLIAQRKYAGSADFDDERYYSYSYAPSVNDMVQTIINSFRTPIQRKLTPTWRTEEIALMSNKPKVATVADAYKLADQGSVEAAYQVFISEWNNSRHVPSGYNAALMLEAEGKLDDAVTLMNEVATSSGNGQAYSALSRMQSAQKNYSDAMNQMSGTSPSGESGTSKTQIVTGF
jgi:hypothetical protein